MVRRTLLQPRLRERFGAAADGLALAVAALWTVHPLQTESVTYCPTTRIVDGAVLPVDAVLLHSREQGRPKALVVWPVRVACALGMASKEVMVAAPLIVLLYDRMFLGV